MRCHINTSTVSTFKTTLMKTEIYNLIILDESGSMDCVKSQTISGCNETINTIRSAQEALPLRKTTT